MTGIVYKKSERWTFNRILITAFLLRLVAVFYARVHDYMFEVLFFINKVYIKNNF